MKKSMKEIELTDLDKKLLFYLHAVKISTYRQIQRDIYALYKIKTVRKRIIKLEDEGLLTGFRSRAFRNGERLIYLSKLGFNSFVANGSEKRIELKSDAVRHDLALNDLRAAFLQCSKVESYYTENQLQTWNLSSFDQDLSSFTKLYCDAVVEIDFPDGNIVFPVEYENAGKSKIRYKNIISKIYRQDEVIAVLYFFKDAGLIRKIQDLELALFPNREAKIFYCLMSMVRNGEAITLVNRCNQTLILEAKPTNQIQGARLGPMLHEQLALPTDNKEESSSNKY